ncbi:MAG TPA: hypothetical protein VLD37_07665 [Candidatus Bilamarchaeum sp.]|nr:hypothetical protein [Candidatus Bilamarchaeum sp.]
MTRPLPERARAAPATKLVVEIGHGAKPLWTTLKRMPLDDQVYLGLDINAEHWPRAADSPVPGYSLSAGRQEIEKRRLEGKQCFWMKIGALGGLPLPDGSVDELYMRYVLCDPRISLTVVEALLASVSLALRPGGPFVVDNFCPRERCGPGDVVVDFEAGTAIFRSELGPVESREMQSRASMILNSEFVPLPPECYSGFLLERGLGERIDPEPGGRFSILLRK